jgi:hypothetical protein
MGSPIKNTGIKHTVNPRKRKEVQADDKANNRKNARLPGIFTFFVGFT